MKKIPCILFSFVALLLLNGCGYQATGTDCYDDSIKYLENITNLKRAIKAGDTDKLKNSNFSMALHYYDMAKLNYESMVFGNCKLINGEKRIIEKKVELNKYKKILDAIPYKEISPNGGAPRNYKTVDYSGLKFRTLEYRVRYGDLR